MSRIWQLRRAAVWIRSRVNAVGCDVVHGGVIVHECAGKGQTYNGGGGALQCRCVEEYQLMSCEVSGGATPQSHPTQTPEHWSHYQAHNKQAPNSANEFLIINHLKINGPLLGACLL